MSQVVHAAIFPNSVQLASALQPTRGLLVYAPMSGNDTGKNQRSKWLTWLKRFFFFVLILFLTFVALHRPILFYGVKYFATRAAANAGMKLSYDMSGSIISSLRIKDLRITPTKPGPIETASVDLVYLKYSIPGLIVDGLSGLLKDVQVVGVDLELNPTDKKPKPEKESKGPIKIPPILPERLRIEDINVVVHAKEKEDLVVKDFDFILDPASEGKLSIEELTIPGVRDWRNVKAKSATYRDRNLVLTDLYVDDQVKLAKLNLDASRLDESRLRLVADGSLFGGTIALDARVSNLNATNDLDVQGSINDISLESISEYLTLKKELAGTLSRIDVNFQGEPAAPETWIGKNALKLKGFAFDGRALVDVLDLRSDFDSGIAVLNLRELRQGATQVQATAEMDLPVSIDRFPWAEMKGRLSIDAPSLAELNLGGQTKLKGAVTVEGPFEMNAGFFRAHLAVKARGVKSEAFAAESAELEIEVSRRLYDPDARKNESAFLPLATHSQYMRVANNSPATPQASAPTSSASPEPEDGSSAEAAADQQSKTGIGELLQGFEFEVKGSATGVRAQDYSIDSVDFNVQGKDGKINVNPLRLRKGKNTFSASGDITVPKEANSLEAAQVEVRLNISAPELRQFVAEQTGKELEGALNVSGDVTRSNGKINGTITATGNDLRFSGLKADSLEADITIDDSVGTIRALTVLFDKKNRLTAKGTVELEKPYRYNGSLEVNLPQLSVLNSLLQAQDKTISGSLIVSWKGSGVVENLKHSGRIDLSANEVVFGDLIISSAAIAGDYSPEAIEIPTFTVNSNQGDLRTKITLSDEQLRIADILVTREGGIELSGQIQLPVDISNPKKLETLIPADGKVDAALAVKELGLAPLLKKGEEAPPFSGYVKANLTASGTVADLLLDLKIEGRELNAAAAERLPTASFDVSVKLQNDRLSLDGSIKQPEINPILITGSIPFDLETILQDKKLDKASPVALDVKLSRSDLSLLTQMSPEVRFIEGTAAIDASIRGTLGAPDLSGAIDATIQSIRFADPSFPSVSDLRVDIRFADQTISVNSIAGDLAGGTFALTGTITVADLTNPVFDLALVANNALVARNDSITVRLNADLSVAGPLDAGVVSGSVAVTNSRFFREIDILPLELPGRPAPVPPSPGGGVSLGPPLNNWTFDVSVTTLDPFQIRGNLANGGVTLDLELVGTGEEPALVGTARIVDFVTTLPFSALRITNGFVYFTKSNPFEPQLNIQGESNLRNYRINVYIYGPASDAKTIFSSEPPLPQEDIISLLATGTTTSELAGDNNVAASRAAALVAQKLWRSIFKKKPAPDKPKDTFLDRIDVNVGAIDPKTGEQEVRAGFRLTEHFQLVGDLDFLGNARAQIRFLIRFK